MDLNKEKLEDAINELLAINNMTKVAYEEKAAKIVPISNEHPSKVLSDVVKMCANAQETENTEFRPGTKKLIGTVENIIGLSLNINKAELTTATNVDAVSVESIEDEMTIM